MWDKKAIYNLMAVVLNAACFNFYLYQLFWGTMEKREARAVYYSVTAIVLLYLIIDEAMGYISNKQWQLNLIAKCCICVNFVFFSLTLYNMLPTPIYYLIAFNGCVFAISIIILISGLRHGYFRTKDAC